LLIVSICIVLLVAVVVGAVVGALAGVVQPIPIIGQALATAMMQIVPVLAFVVIVYLIKIVLLPDAEASKKWFVSIWSTVITMFLIFLVNALAAILFGYVIIPGP